jgi:hypothetical protein
MARASSKTAGGPQIRDVEAKLAEIKQMPVRELQALWLELYGAETRTRNRPYLQKRLAHRVQELAEGGLSERAREKASELQGKRPPRRREDPAAGTPRPGPGPKKARDARLPRAGTTLEREYQGKVYTVTVHDTDFEYAEARYGSLSTIAREITGQVWNGFVFFGSALRQHAADKGAA